jgi:uncharacterized membrane protein
MKIGTTRVETFSDGVVAIIITIMVLSLKLPDMNKDATARALHHHLQVLVPYFIPYAFSFMMIGIFWINHHHMFHLLEKTDEPLLLWNLLFLFWMSLVPLGTAMIGTTPTEPDAVAFYGFILLCTTLSLAIMRYHTIRRGLVHQDKDRAVNQEIRGVTLKARTKSYFGAGAYLISVPLAYASVYAAYVCFLVSAIIFFIPDGIDDERLAERIEEKNG